MRLSLLQNPQWSSGVRVKSPMATQVAQWPKHKDI